MLKGIRAGLLVLVSLAAWPLAAQPQDATQQPARGSLELPSTGSLEGTPRFRVDLTPDSAERRELDQAEAGRNPLRVRVKDGQFYWESRGNRALRLEADGPFTYLSAGPGNYIRLTRVNDRISYVEHVESREFGSITWWGELRVIVGQ